MPTQILAAGTTAANSADVVVASGDELTVALKAAAGPVVPQESRVLVLLKDDAGQYFIIDELNSTRPALVISAGTYRLQRLATGANVGAFSA